MTATATEKSVLHITDETGDTRLMWDPTNKDEVDIAKSSFEKGIAKGMLAYSVNADGTTGEVIRKFDKKAGKIIMVRQTAGG